ncbi:Suppressor of ypt1 [Pelomyxa schiedti]|nr:Suppressor of ypt1 [Pelomyxa schiedti]
MNDFSFSVRERQTAAIVGMLQGSAAKNSGSSSSSSSSSSTSATSGASTVTMAAPDTWKVVVFDQYCGDVLALLLRVGDFRNNGVTLTMPIDSDRQPIPDAPAIYFMRPTQNNIERLCKDCADSLYQSFCLNFASPVPHPMLEQIAIKTVQTNSAHKIQKVYDQYLDFFSLENEFFDLNMSGSYLAFNDHSRSDSEAEAFVDKVSQNLFSVLFTLRVIPIIRAPKNSVAEMVAGKLNGLLRAQIQKEGGVSSYSMRRPLLVIIERNVDLSVMVAHPWTYQALIHDLLEFALNRVKVPVPEEPKPESASTAPPSTSPVIHKYDLDTTQAFWVQTAGLPFPTVATQIKACVTEYQTAMNELNALGGADTPQKEDLNTTAAATPASLPSKTSLVDGNFTKFVDRVPQLRENKKIADIHTEIATALLRQIKDRALDVFFSYEETLMTHSYLDTKEIYAILTDPTKEGTPNDKLRLYLIYLLSTTPPPSADVQREIEQALSTSGADLNIVNYIKRNRTFSDNLQATLSTTSAASKPTASSWLNISGVFDKLVGGVQALLPKSKDLHMTRIVDSLMELKGGLTGGAAATADDTYLYLDPKVIVPTRPSTSGASVTSLIPRKTTPFRDAIVFVIGGGNYIEYQNLQDYAKRSPQLKRIIYGTTELMNASQFLQQVAPLGSQS